MYSSDFEKGFAFAISPEVEGGLSDIKGDAGGRTIFGISERWYPEVEHQIEALIKAGKPAMQDVKQFYYDEFWVKNGCASLPYSLNCFLFDSSVNAGQSSSREIIKIALSIYYNNVSVILNSTDINEIFKQEDGDLLTYLACSVRVDRYLTLADQNPVNGQFLKGWLNRVKHFRKTFLSEAYW